MQIVKMFLKLFQFFCYALFGICDKIDGIMGENCKFDKIHIMGASGSGATSLASALCGRLSRTHFDSDDYFWKNKYSEAWPSEVRLKNLAGELAKVENWILSGAIIDWGNPLIPLFDLVVFLSVPDEIRIRRLINREKERYGESILPGGEKHRDFVEFIEWAKRYEDGGTEVRSRYQQEQWLEDLSCPVLRIDGESSIEHNSEIVFDYIADCQQEAGE